MRYKFFIGLVFMVWLVAGCKAPQPTIAYDSETHSSDTTALSKRDSTATNTTTAVSHETGAATMSIIREVRDSTITHIITKDSTSTIIREYHTERTDIDLSFLFAKIDSLHKADSIAFARSDSIAASMTARKDTPVVVEVEKRLTFWQQIRTQLGCAAFWLLIIVGAAWLIERKFKNSAK